MQKNYLNVNFLPGWSQSTHENIICEEERVAQHDNNKDKEIGSPLIYQKRSSHLLTSIAYKYKVIFFCSAHIWFEQITVIFIWLSSNGQMIFSLAKTKIFLKITFKIIIITC